MAITNNAADYSPTQFNVQVGGINGTLVNVPPSAVSGIPLISNGIASNPSFSTAVVAGGGTGAVTFTSNGVLLGNTTGPITATAVGTTGQVLTGVTGSAPTFQAPAASSITITGDTGGGLTGNSFTFTGGTTGLSFGGAGTTETLTFAGITANGGTVSLATDATTSTINIGTGAGVKTSTFGSTNTTSSTIIKSGSGNIVLNSGLTVDSTGRTKNAVQPCFQAHITVQASNVTGDGTTYTILFDTIDINQGSSYSAGTGIFTAPIAGNYYFTGACQMGVGATHTSGFVTLASTGFNAIAMLNNAFAVSAATNLGYVASSVLKMAAGDTCKFTVTISGGTKTASVGGANGYFGGYLIC